MSKLKAFIPALFALALTAPPAHAAGNLVAVLEAEIVTLDPHFSTAYISRTFGYMVFDTLFAKDSKGEIKPQMVQDWKVSADGLTYSFTLRDGLKWHDGQPVTAADCVASLRRWGTRSALGRRIFAITASLEPTDAKTFVLTLKEPSGLVIDALGNPVSPVAFMMPERIAKTPGDQRITEIVGSGPFVYSKADHRTGDRMILKKFADYVPRPEPADFLAGGKRVNIDTLEIRVIPDGATAASALQAGEIDFMQYAPFDLLPTAGEEFTGQARQFHRRQHVRGRLSPQRRIEAVRRSRDPARAVEAGRSARSAGCARARRQIRHTLRDVLHLRHHL